MSPTRRERFTIRAVRVGEHEALGALTVGAYAADFPEAEDGYAAELRDVAARAAVVPVLVAVGPDERILGGVTYVPGPGTALSESERDGEAGFRMLAVDPAARGGGVGRALVEACVGRARAEGKTAVVLYTLPSMRPAHALYESMGFRREPDRDWEFEPGAWLWSYVLAL